MNLSNYQRAAERTMLGTQPVQDAMLNAALGLCGEAAEIAEAFHAHASAPMLEECGDLLWYAAQHCKACGYSLEQFAPRDNEGLDRLWYATGKLADMAKKQVFHQKNVSKIDRWELMDIVLSAVNTALILYGYTLSDACEHNNRKLLMRFPAGFTPAAANARLDEASS